MPNLVFDDDMGDGEDHCHTLALFHACRSEGGQLGSTSFICLFS